MRPLTRDERESVAKAAYDAYRIRRNLVMRAHPEWSDLSNQDKAIWFYVVADTLSTYSDIQAKS